MSINGIMWFSNLVEILTEKSCTTWYWVVETGTKCSHYSTKLAAYSHFGISALSQTVVIDMVLIWDMVVYDNVNDTILYITKNKTGQTVVWDCIETWIHITIFSFYKWTN